MSACEIFISYSHLDRFIVAPLTSLLRVANQSVFRDEESIQPGQIWHIKICQSIETAQKMIVFWSANSAQSAEVRGEYLTAVDLKKSIIPVLLDETPLASELAKYQWVDFTGLALTVAGKTKRSEEEVWERVTTWRPWAGWYEVPYSMRSYESLSTDFVRASLPEFPRMSKLLVKAVVDQETDYLGG